jgi:hypothetical protein
MLLPSVFCWTKFGTEAGETADSILQRKEVERARNDGTFLWGIGNSIRPSVLQLLEVEQEPAVIFTPMLSRPAPRDVKPNIVGTWKVATGLDGAPFAIPDHTHVTSGTSSRQAPRRHFALVCQRDQPMPAPDHEGWVDDAALRNLRTGSMVGASQVTSVVTCRCTPGAERQRYRVAFRATLVYPFFVELSDWVQLGRDADSATATAGAR